MLYRAYRPQTFDQVVGQESVVRALQGALTANQVAHAYLFAGPRGTGKTTLARILAKALNCEHRAADGNPDDTCPACLAVDQGRSLDLIEIDGASNGRVDEMRSLKDSATVGAISGGFKVFLIDEVHMVTTGGFNALLKILEEPPAHVIFIFATTDPHKIPATILSRVQRFDFRKLTPEQIVTKLTNVAKTEGIQIDAEALLTIANASDGALRDAEVSLSKILASYPAGHAITASDVRDTLGLIPVHYHPQFLQSLLTDDRAGAITLIQQIHDSGVSLEHFGRDFLEYLHRLLIQSIDPALGAGLILPVSGAPTPSETQLVTLIEVFTKARQELKFSPVPQLPLELAVIAVTKKQTG